MTYSDHVRAKVSRRAEWMVSTILVGVLWALVGGPWIGLAAAALYLAFWLFGAAGLDHALDRRRGARSRRS